MAKKAWLRFLLPGVLILIVGVGLLVKFGMERAVAEDIAARFPDRGVPRINITLNDVTLDEIKEGSKDTKYEDNELSLYEGSEVREFGKVRVKGRGNGTWLQEKKPYQIKFEKKVDLFGMGKAKKWVLLANAMDASNLRNDLTFELARMLEMEYVFNGQFVELYFDGRYEGLYYLTHAVEIGKSAVDLKDPMGVLVELDNLYGWEERHYDTRTGEMLVVKDVVSNSNEEVAMEEFVKELNELEVAIEKNDYNRVVELADVDSFVQYFLLNEFTVNPDAYQTSFYFYKDGLSDKIHAGPGWDFDLAFANRNWINWMGEPFYSPAQSMVRKGEILPREAYEEMAASSADWEDWYNASLSMSRIMFELMEMPEFEKEVSRVYQERLSGRIQKLIMVLDNRVDELGEVIRSDNEKWNKGDYREEIKRMAEWIKERCEYFEKEYGNNTESQYITEK